jgi:hypothetical protein
MQQIGNEDSRKVSNLVGHYSWANATKLAPSGGTPARLWHASTSETGARRALEWVFRRHCSDHNLGSSGRLERRII